MAISVETRTRANEQSTWSAWAPATQTPPYVDTATVEYRVIDSNRTDVGDITENVTVSSNHVVSGDGIFDDIMETVNAHIKAQFDANRIKNTDIATLYVGIIPSVLSESIKLALQTKTSAQQLRVLEAQEALYQRQKDAFDDNKFQKLFEAQLNYNGMVFQDSGSDTVATVATEPHLADVYNKLVGLDAAMRTADEEAQVDHQVGGGDGPDIPTA